MLYPCGLKNVIFIHPMWSVRQEYHWYHSLTTQRVFFSLFLLLLIFISLLYIIALLCSILYCCVCVLPFVVDLPCAAAFLVVVAAEQRSIMQHHCTNESCDRNLPPSRSPPHPLHTIRTLSKVIGDRERQCRKSIRKVLCNFSRSKRSIRIERP